MTTKPRTKKTAAKPQRKPRKPTEKTASAMIDGQSIGSAILGKLDDLLAMTGNDSMQAVSASSVEKLGDGVTGYRANYATELGTASENGSSSPINKAIAHLIGAILGAERATQDETERLSSVLSPPFPASNIETAPAPGAGVLSGAINSLAERIYADNRRRNELLDRLEL